MQCYNPMLKKNYNVRGFIDSNVTKYSWKGLPVWQNPKMIDVYFDYIVIMNKFVNEIKQSVQVSFPTVSDKVINISDLFTKCIDGDCLGFKDSHVLFYGDRLAYEYIEFRARYTFKEISFIENNEQLINIKDSTFDYIFLCPPRLVSAKDCECYEQNFRSGLYKNNISAPHIFSWQEWHYYLECDRTINISKECDKQNFYIVAVADPIQGFGNLLIRILGGIAYAKKKNLIPVIDMMHIQNQYLEPCCIGKHNAWLDFFYPINEYNLDMVYSTKNAILSGVDSNLYEAKNWNDIKLRENIIDEIETYKHSFGFLENKVLGVVYRGTDYYRAAVGHADPLKIETFIENVKLYMQKFDYTKLYLATEVEEAVKVFESAFGSCVCYIPQKRYQQAERRFLSQIQNDRKNDNYLRGKEYLTVLCLLAECAGIYGGDNGATRLALVINQGKYQNVNIC